MSELATPSAAPTPPSAARRRWQSLGLAALIVGGSLGLAWLMHRPDPTPPTGGSTAGGSEHPDRPQPPRPITTLNVATTPPGAVVIVDDRIVGTSPLKAIALTPGSHAIRCEKEGFEPAVARTDTATGQPDLRLTLAPVAYAELTVASQPSGAEILIDGEFRGRTPATVRKLPPGPHELIIQKENYSTYQSTQLLRAGEHKTLANITLENRLLAMLQELCATEPRLISNHLDLAHFYYVNNQMEAAAREYARCIELSKLPMEVLPAEATEAEKEQVRLNYDWDKSRVRSELDKHTKKYRDYFGNTLDFDSFLKYFKEYTARRWDLADADWVAGEADLQIAVGNPGRAVELFSDVLTREPASLAASCGLACAYFSAGNAREGLARLELAAAADEVNFADLKVEERRFFGRTLRWLVAADLQALQQASPADRDRLRQQLEKHLASAQKAQAEAGAKVDPYESAQLLRLEAHRACQQGAAATELARLQQALQAAATAVKNDTDKDHQARNATLREQLQAETAQALTAQGDTAAARELWQQLAQEGAPSRPFQARAKAALQSAPPAAPASSR